MDPQLKRFYEAAVQLAAAAHFDAIELGCVYDEREPRFVFAMRIALVRHSMVTAQLAPLTTSVVSARREVYPLTALEPLLEMLSQGRLEKLGDGSWPVIRLTATEAKPVGWSFYGDYRGGTPSSTAYARWSQPHEYPEEFQRDKDGFDRIIAHESRYRYASMERVVKAFVGLRWDREHPFTEIQLTAPWPVGSILAARYIGQELQLEIEGFSQIDTSQFILNVEGNKDDVSLDKRELRWFEVPAPTRELAIYKTAIKQLTNIPTAVNLYLESLPGVSLRREVSVETSDFARQIYDPFFRGVKQEPTTAAASDARLTTLRVSSYRLLRTAELSWAAQPFSVIVGPNQSGKSTVLDALQLLSDSARGRLADALLRKRGGLLSVQSRGAKDPSIGLEAELQDSNGRHQRYRLRLRATGNFDYGIEEESLSTQEGAGWFPVFTRKMTRASLEGVDVPVRSAHETLLAQLQGTGVAHVAPVASALSSIAVYPFFRLGAAWAAQENIPMRSPGRPEPGARLDPTGDNLAAALYSLREEQPDDWKELLGVLQLIFPVQDIHLRPVAKGTLQLEWEEKGGARFDASELSDGTLGLLATFCALYQRGRALIAIDEPEQHLHPDALLRLVGVAQSLSVRQPILFTTQSDTLIGLLDETPDAIVIARRDEEGTQLIRPQLSELQEWLKTFSLREMRRELEGWNPPA